MSERPDGAAAEQATDNTSQPDLRAASEAAAEHSMRDAEAFSEVDRLRGELDALRAEHAAVHDKYVRLHAEFDNFRKRTAKERLELLQSAAGDTLKRILPVLDDLDRAVVHNAVVDDIDTVKQGVELVQQKFSNILLAQGLKPMHCKGEPFDPDLHEAITKAPAPTPDLKGKVIDVVENGYLLHDKVLRYAKVVVGE
ncbi:MAG: nucleotide exchange factor GrpE [Bacteroidetes bacterium]|nr:nucleotide exchange factor GrpE [Bacteroidota bacterium]